MAGPAVVGRGGAAPGSRPGAGIDLAVEQDRVERPVPAVPRFPAHVEHDLGGVVPVVGVVSGPVRRADAGRVGQQVRRAAPHVFVVAVGAGVHVDQHADGGHGRRRQTAVTLGGRVAGERVVAVQVVVVAAAGVGQPAADAVVNLRCDFQSRQLAALERHHHPARDAGVGADLGRVPPSAVAAVLGGGDVVQRRLGGASDADVAGHPVGFGQRQGGDAVGVKHRVAVADGVHRDVQVAVGRLVVDQPVDAVGDVVGVAVFPVGVSGTLKGEHRQARRGGVAAEDDVGPVALERPAAVGQLGPGEVFETGLDRRLGVRAGSAQGRRRGGSVLRCDALRASGERRHRDGPVDPGRGREGGGDRRAGEGS